MLHFSVHKDDCMGFNIPENVGIPSEKIIEYYQYLEDHNLSTHAVYIARGNDIVSFAHWRPFTQKFLHRMYSVSKSFVAIAVGFAMQDGLLDLDDPIVKYFPEETAGRADENVQRQTIRNMLMMSTAKPATNWFAFPHPNRVDRYFDNPGPSRVPGTQFQYDSSGSFVLGALVERLTGMPFMDYLRVKLFDKIGVSKEAYCLRCPGGHSWGDSGVMCTSADLVRMVRFVANGGSWGGEQLLDRDYVKAASSKQIDNNLTGIPDWETSGYGYQIWMGLDDSFFFNGMGCQFGLYMPKKDMILVYNGDNQGKAGALNTVMDGFREIVYASAADAPIPLLDNTSMECPKNQLRRMEEGFQLMADKGSVSVPMMEKINGKTFELAPNPMGITRFTITVDENGDGRFCYTNAKGDLELPFGMCRNIFGEFPHDGYSDEVGNVPVPGHRYKCAASAAWYSPYQFHLKVQIIDKYFGTMDTLFGFSGDGRRVCVQMTKTAEDFLQGYAGWADGKIRE